MPNIYLTMKINQKKLESFGMNRLLFIFTSLMFYVTVASGESPIEVTQSLSQPGYYHLKVQNRDYEIPVLFVQEFLSGKISTTPAYLSADGILCKREEGYPPLSLDFSAMKPGEPLVFNVLSCDRLRSTTKKPEYLTLRYVHQPIRTSNSIGVSLSCELADDQMESFWIKMDGLNSNEEVYFTIAFVTEKHSVSHQADENGKIEFLFAFPEKTLPKIEAANQRIESLRL